MEREGRERRGERERWGRVLYFVLFISDKTLGDVRVTLLCVCVCVCDRVRGCVFGLECVCASGGGCLCVLDQFWPSCLVHMGICVHVLSPC